MTQLLSPPITIEDPEDPRLDDIRNLNSSDKRPDLPGNKGLVIAEGTLVIPRLIESIYPVRCIVGLPEKIDTLRSCLEEEAIQGREETPIHCYAVERETLAKVVGFDMHRGIVAAADRVPPLSWTQVLEKSSSTDIRSSELPDHNGATKQGTKRKVIAVLEGVGNHENIGSIFRNAACMGVSGILLGSGCADPLYRRAVRVSMGHVLRIPFGFCEGTYTTWQRELSLVREYGYEVLAMTPNTTQELSQYMLQCRAERIAIMVGAEGPGLTEHAMKAADQRVAIPMAEGSDSLNVATAAALGFYAAQHS